MSNIIQLPAAQNPTTPEALTALWNSKTFHGNGRVRFDHPEQVFRSLITRAKATGLPVHYNVKTGKPVSVVDKDTEEKETAYARVFVDVTFGDAEMGMHRTVGLAYAFDLGTPLIIPYTGGLVEVCTNLTIFNADHTVQLNYLSNSHLVEGILDGYFEKIDDTFARTVQTAQEMQNRVLMRHQVHECLGRMLTYAARQKSKAFGIQIAGQVAEKILNPESRYALSQDGSTTAWNLFNAATAVVGEKAYPHVRPIKTVQLAQFFLN